METETISHKTFLNWKKQTLNKEDKSTKGFFDEKIVSLCNKINENPNIFTLSSCSGRISILEKEDKKNSNWLYVTHDFAEFPEIKTLLENYYKKEQKKNNSQIYFIQESVILHICCFDIKTALEIMDFAKSSGFNRRGIISMRKISIELICDVSINCPISDKDTLKIDDNYLNFLIEKSNENQKISWEVINKFEKKFNQTN